jgi:hypothetical protein
MPKIPNGIRTIREACEWLLKQPPYSAGAKVVKEIYQGSSELLTKAAAKLGKQEAEQFGDVMEGVCHGMAVTWIRSSSQIGGIEGFHEIVDKDWQPFALEQDQIHHQKAGLETRIEAIQADRAKIRAKGKEIDEEIEYQQNPGFLYAVAGFGKKPLTGPEVRRKLLNHTADLQEIDDRIAKVGQYEKDMRASYVFDKNTDFNKFELAARSVAFLTLVGSLNDYLSADPAFYLLELNKTGAGHAVAFHAAYRPRFMDANSCEFQFTDMQTFHSFFVDYMDIYSRMGYRGGNCSLLRYRIRLAKGRAAVHTLMIPVLADLRRA